jgi:RNA polymerase sigma-70 factor (ECF subfamily)
MAVDSISTHFNVDATSRAAFEDRFRTLLEGDAPALARLAASYTRSASDRDDLLQDIAMAVWKALPRFRGECSERTFLFRIAQNRCLAHLSKRRVAVPLDEVDIEQEDPAPTTEHQISLEQERHRLVAAVRRLPLIYRQAITLSLEGLSYKELAEVLGISESNVGVRLNRARTLLKTFLEEHS